MASSPPIFCEHDMRDVKQAVKVGDGYKYHPKCSKCGYVSIYETTNEDSIRYNWIGVGGSDE